MGFPAFWASPSQNPSDMSIAKVIREGDARITRVLRRRRPKRPRGCPYHCNSAPAYEPAHLCKSGKTFGDVAATTWGRGQAKGLGLEIKRDYFAECPVLYEELDTTGSGDENEWLIPRKWAQLTSLYFFICAVGGLISVRNGQWPLADRMFNGQRKNQVHFQQRAVKRCEVHRSCVKY